MAGISYEHFLLMLKNIYTSKIYSDVQIKITEEECESYVQDNLNMNSSLTSAAEEFTPITIDAHALILYMNSVYFEKHLTNHQQGSSKIEITVKVGQAKYLEIIITAFYDEMVLQGRSVGELLEILELALIYANDEFVTTVITYLVEMEVDVNMYNRLLTKIQMLEEGGNHINEGIITKCKNKYIHYLAKLFFPIEEKHNEHRQFMELDYASIFYLLQSDDLLSRSENSLLTFIIFWLEHNETRQTANVIKGLLGNIRIKFLTFNFLYSTIKIDHYVLNKWEGYHDWFVYNIGALGMSGSLQQCNYPNLDQTISRNSGIHGWYEDAQHTHLNACRWIVRMTPEKPGELFEPTEHILVHNGLQFSPKCIDITLLEEDESKFKMSLSISCKGSVANVRFVLGIVPADREYDITSNKHFGSEFARNFLKWTEPLSFNLNVHVIDSWTIDKEFIGHVNEHSMYVLLLPVTEEEYHQLEHQWLLCSWYHITINSKCKYCEICRHDSIWYYSKNNTKITHDEINPTSQLSEINLASNSTRYNTKDNSKNTHDEIYPTSQLTKINLSSSCNYSL